MTSTQNGLLIIQVLLSVLVAMYVAYEWFKGKREQQKYKLYAIRDRLLNLAATGKFSQSDPLFMLFYEVINHSISVAKDLTFVSFIKASVRAQTELEQQTQSAELSKKIESEPLEVREFVSAFASTMMGIMMANSLLLIVLVKIGYRCYAVLKRIVRPNMFPKQRRKIQAYHYFKRLHEVEYGSTIHTQYQTPKYPMFQ